jgi:hypothetical protein
MAVYVSNIAIPGGTDFQQTFYLESVSNTPLNLNGYTGYAQLKKSSASLNSSAAFTVSFPNPSQGLVKISLGSSITSTLRPGRYCYDILLEGGGTKTRVVEGSALVTAGITIA